MKIQGDKAAVTSLTNTPIFLFGLLIAGYSGTQFNVFRLTISDASNHSIILAQALFHAFVIAILAIFIISMVIWSYIDNKHKRTNLTITQQVAFYCIDWGFGSVLLFASFVAGGSITSLVTLFTLSRGAM